MTKPINPMLTRCSALALSTSLALMSGVAHAQSFNGQGLVVEGDAIITEGSDTTTITVETQSAVIDWTPDDNAIANFAEIAFQDAGTTATFTNGTGVSDFAVLNRILPSDVTRAIRLDGNIVSQIQDGMGTVTGGTVFFYTPGGIIIGPNATIDVGSLGLTTAAPVTDGAGNFIVGDQVQFQQSRNDVAIQIEGGAQINALNEGSYVALFSPRIGQFGDINVNGTAALVAGEAGTMTFSPDGLFDIEVTIGTEQFNAIDHRGSTGGPASSGAGDNHRAYLVAVAKNDAISMAINGGSELGFDVAGAASMDGNTVVLSSGYNIVDGQIDGLQAGGNIGSISINTDQFSPTPNVLFTSALDARASAQISGFITNDLVFEGDTQFAAEFVTLTVQNDPFGPNPAISGNVVARGDLAFLADTNNEFGDVGSALLDFRGGSSLQVDGSLVIASNAFFDTNGDSTVRSETARLLVDETSTATIGGNLIVDASVDLEGGRTPVTAQAGFAQILVETGGSITVGGATRIRSDAFGPDGFAGNGNIAELSVNQGGNFTTGELNISADAFGGIDIGAGGGDANAGQATISLFSTGTQLTVSSPNVTGQQSEGDLNFLSSQAVAGDGVTENGGNASSGTISLNVQDGATLSLPNVVGAPLLVLNSARGGNTPVNGRFAGSANVGQTILQAFNSSGDFGNLFVSSIGRGGFAMSGATGTRGGDAFGGAVSIDFFDSAVDIAFDRLEVNLTGGDGGLGDGGNGGGVFSGLFGINVFNSVVNVGSDLNFSVFAEGGLGNQGGSTNVTGANVTFQDSDVTVAGNFISSARSTGGVALTPDALDPINGAEPSEVGGNASISATILRATDTNLDVSGLFSLFAIATGGNAQDTKGGNAVADFVDATITGASTLTAQSFSVQSVAAGGSIEPGGVGRGGSAQSGFARLGLEIDFNTSIGDNDVTLTGGFTAISSATAGSGGDTAPSGTFFRNTDGGFASAGESLIFAQGEGTLTIGGTANLRSEATGGNAVFGRGGNATAGVADINSTGVDLQFEGNASLQSLASAGAGFAGGSAETFGVGFNLDSSTANLLENTTFFAQAVGGDAVDGPIPGGSGGDATTGTLNLNFIDSVVDISTSIVSIVAQGGAGSSSALTQGGNAFGGGLNLFSRGSDLNFRSGLSLLATAFGGDGFSGGFAESNFSNFTVESSNVSIDGRIDLQLDAFGGDALGVRSNDPSDPFDGGTGGSANSQTLFFTSDGSTLTTTGPIGLIASARGGDAVDGDAGSADSGQAFTNFRDGSITTAPTINLTSNARGGSVGTGGAGNGGNATALRAGHEISAFDPQTGELRANTDVVINADLNARSQATGGAAGTFGGDGGAANSDFSSLIASAEGTFLLNGALSVVTTANGGAASFGTGGVATAAGAEVFAVGQIDPITGIPAPSSDVTINGSVDITGTAIGGDGANGGAANGPFLRIFNQNGSIVTSGDATVTGLVTGGNAFASITPGNGGLATGGSVRIISESRPGEDPTLISVENLIVNTTVQGGDGGDNLTISDGGQGGEAVGFEAFILGRAFDGTLEARGNGVFNFNAIGGAGGDGVNGGDGGLGSARTVLVGTSSGGSVPDQVNGAARYTALTIVNDGTGGAGGNASTGTGGTGGAGEGNQTSINVRGAPLIAESVNFSTTGRGGDGGSGATQGDGGYGIGGFLSSVITQAFENPGRGSTQIGALTMISEGIGGNGTSPGASFYPTGGSFEITQSDVDIGSFDVQLVGTVLPVVSFTDPVTGDQVPIDVVPYDFTLTDATFVADSVNIVTPGETQTDFSSSLLTANTFSITASELVLPELDPMGPPQDPNRGNLNIADQIALTAIEGDLAFDAELIAGNEIILNAPGNITAGDLTAPSVFLESQMGTISTGNVTTNGGAVSIQSLDTLDLEAAFASVDANSITARSINGDVISTVDLSLSGDLVIEASQAIAVEGLTASSITATSMAGNITTGRLLGTGGAVSLDSAGAITATEIEAASALLLAVGELTISDLALVAGDFEATAGAALTLADVTSATGSIMATTQGELLVGALSAVDGVITLDGILGVRFAFAAAQSLTATSGSGAVETSDLISLSDALVVTGQSITLSDANAGSIDANTNGSFVAGALDTGSGAIDVLASTGASLSDVSAGSLTVLVSSGALDASGGIIVGETVNLQARETATLSAVSGSEIVINTTDGGAIVGVLNGDTIALTTGGDTAFEAITGGAFEAVVQNGDLTSIGSVNLTGAFEAVATNGIALADVTAEVIAIDAQNGSALLGALTGTTIGVQAETAVLLSDVAGGSANAVSRAGDLMTTGSIDLADTFVAQALGSVDLNVVTAGEIDILATNGNLEFTSLAATLGAAVLQSQDTLELGSITGIGIQATSTQGDIVSAGLIDTQGTVQLEAAGSIALAALTADTLLANATGGDITASGALTTIGGDITLRAAGSIDVVDVNAASLALRTAMGNVTSNGAITLTGQFDAQSGTGIILDAVTANQITANAADGSVIAGSLDAQSGLVRLQAATSVALETLSGGSLIGIAQQGDFNANDFIAVTGALDVDATGDINLATVTSGAFDAQAGQTLSLGTVTANSIVGRAATGEITSGTLVADAGAIDLEAALGVALTSVDAGSLQVSALGGDIAVSDLITLTSVFDAVASGAITLGDVSASTITANAAGGDFVAGSLIAQEAINLDALGSILFASISGLSFIADTEDGDVESTGAIDLVGDLQIDATGIVNLGAITSSSVNIAAASASVGETTANSITAVTQSGDFISTGTLTVDNGAIDLQSAGAISLASIIADSLTARAQNGGVSSNGLLNLSGLLDIEAAQSLEVAEIDAGSINSRSIDGNITGTGTITAQGDASFATNGALQLADVTAGRIAADGLGNVDITGQWTASQIEVTTPLLRFLDDGALAAGASGSIVLTFTNGSGLVIGDVGENGGEMGEPPLELTDAMLAAIEGGELTVSASANAEGSDILVGAFDTASASGVGALRFATTDPNGTIRVIGAVTSGSTEAPQELGFRSGRFELDTDTGSVDLTTVGGDLSISANVILVGGGELIAATSGDEAPDALIESFNAISVEPGAAPALSVNSLILEGGRAILIQNSGTVDEPAGFVVGSAEGLQVRSRVFDPSDDQRPLVVINGQINANGTTTSGIEAGTAFLQAQSDTSDLAPASVINGCELGGCITTDQGEVTSDVSAQVNGVIDSGSSNSGAGTGSNNSGSSGSGESGAGDTGAGDTGSGDSSGSDSGSSEDSGSDESGDDASEENADNSGGTNAGSTDTGSNSGGDVNPDNVDDGGGGNDDFVIEDNSGDGSDGSDTSGGDDGAGSDDGGVDDSGSDDGGSDDSGSDDAGSDDSGDETEGGDENDGGEDTDGGEESEGGDDESDAEESDESEDSEEAEEESDEEESEEEEDEEEASEEEDEDSEGPATGPIPAPPALIDTNNLERNTVISDPISGTGNPALLDPEINVPEPPAPPANESGGSQ
ncbi:MAG: hypothetical protein AAF251_01935 [Pseudomonadota bacterium]